MPPPSIFLNSSEFCQIKSLLVLKLRIGLWWSCGMCRKHPAEPSEKIQPMQVFESSFNDELCHSPCTQQKKQTFCNWDGLNGPSNYIYTLPLLPTEVSLRQNPSLIADLLINFCFFHLCNDNLFEIVRNHHQKEPFQQLVILCCILREQL